MTVKELPPEPNPERVAEKIKTAQVEKEPGYLYFVDKDGDVARVPAKWNEDPKFTPKTVVEKAPVNIPKPAVVHETPVPATPAQVPAEFANKEVVYFDDGVVVTVNDQALVKGHARAYSKLPATIRTVPEDVLIHNLTAASLAASVIFQGLGAQGTNIIVNQTDYIETSIIPRYENDGLTLMWEMKQGDPAKVSAMAKRIQDALIIGEIAEKGPEKVNFDEGKQKKVNIIDREELNGEPPRVEKDYMIDHLRRIP
jgi:diadenosine tetraphosphate (Ap4A) HIT family hydrolase